jgi:drug/metabolite transporter (DMT)-like permease
MTITVFCILLFAALLHASWNAIVKAGTDKLYSAISVSGSATLIALVLLPFSPQPSAASWPFLIVSCALQVVYTVLVAKTYQVSDMSQTYPADARHRAAAGGADQRAGARRSSLLARLVRHRGDLPVDSGDGDERAHAVTQGIWLALLNACFIAGYTLVDGTGVRLSDTALGYTLWTFFMNGFCLLSWAMVARRREASGYLRLHWKKGLLGGSGPWALTVWRCGR